MKVGKGDKMHLGKAISHDKRTLRNIVSLQDINYTRLYMTTKLFQRFSDMD